MLPRPRKRILGRLAPILALAVALIAVAALGFRITRDLSAVAAHVPQTNVAPPNLQDAFPEAPASELTEQGLQLFSPTSAERAGATQVQAQAESAAVKFRGDGTTIRRSILVRLQYLPNSSFDCVCWAISVIPPGGIAVPHRPAPPPGTTPAPVPPYVSKYNIVFVNAGTGVIQMTVERGDQA